MTEQEINQQAAEQICGAGQFDGRMFREGDCVALLDGNVVAVTNDLDGALKALRRLDASPSRGMVLEVGPLIDVIR